MLAQFQIEMFIICFCQSGHDSVIINIIVYRSSF